MEKEDKIQRVLGIYTKRIASFNIKQFSNESVFHR